MTHDCNHRGHVWLTADDQPYSRERGTDLDATVDVHCQHCPEARQLPRFSTYSGKRAPGQPIDKTIPPAFKAVLDRAVIEAQKPNNGPVPKPQ